MRPTSCHRGRTPQPWPRGTASLHRLATPGISCSRSPTHGVVHPARGPAARTRGSLCPTCWRTPGNRRQSGLSGSRQFLDGHQGDVFPFRASDNAKAGGTDNVFLPMQGWSGSGCDLSSGKLESGSGSTSRSAGLAGPHSQKPPPKPPGTAWPQSPPAGRSPASAGSTPAASPHPGPG